MGKSRIIIIGGINIDLVMHVPRVPQLGETVKGLDFVQTPGGKGANQAVACAKLGGEATMLAKVGNDGFAAGLMENLKSSGVRTDIIRPEDTFTGVALIMVDGSGNNIISFAPGANGQLSCKDIDERIDELSNNDLLLIQNECPSDTVFYAIRKASESGLKVIYNPAPAADIPDAVLSICDVIVPNETEAETITGIKVDSPDSCRKAAEYFINKGCKAVVLTLGAGGAYYRTDSDSGIIPAPAVDAVDTVAAGDVFLGAFSVRYGEGCSISEAVRYANHAAALSVTKHGAQTSIPDIEAVYKYFPDLRSEI